MYYMQCNLDIDCIYVFNSENDLFLEICYQEVGQSWYFFICCLFCVVIFEIFCYYFIFFSDFYDFLVFYFKE